MNTRIFADGDALARGTAEAIVRAVQQGARCIALSGGSTPRAVYELLGSSMKDVIADHDVTWIVVDERYVPPDDARSNLAMLRETLFAHGVASRHRLVAFDTTIAPPEDAAAAFAQSLRASGCEQLDLCLLGVGEDGHTASLFPETDALEVNDRDATALFVPKLEMWRLTLTLPVLQRASRRWVLAAGSGKREILQRLGRGEGLPIERALEGEGENWFFLDEAATPESWR